MKNPNSLNPQPLSTNDLINTLSQQLEASPEFNPNAIICSTLCLFCLPLLGIFILMLGLRSDWPVYALAKPGGFLLLGLFCLFQLTVLAKPVKDFTTQSLLLLPVIAVCFALLLLAPTLSWNDAIHYETRNMCLIWITGWGATMYLALRTILHRARPRRPRVFAALLGLFAATLTAAFYASHCPQDALTYIVASYVPALLGITALGALLPHKRWYW